VAERPVSDISNKRESDVEKLVFLDSIGHNEKEKGREHQKCGGLF